MDPPSSIDRSGTVSDTVADTQESPVSNKLKPVSTSMDAPELNDLKCTGVRLSLAPCLRLPEILGATLVQTS